MKNILTKIKINNFTYYFLILSFLCGLIKNTLILFTIIIIHELGHVITIKAFRYDIEKLEIYPFGGITRINKLINSNILKDFLIAISGVLFQFTIINIIINFINFSDNTLNIIKYYNKSIIIFNLLPIIPLDGSKIITNILELFFSYKISYYLTIIISFISIFLFINYNFIYSLNNYLIILLLIFYTIRYLKDYKYMFNKFLLERIMYKLQYKKIINDTKNITELKKETLHFFKENNKYIKENKKIAEIFDKNTYF